MFDAEAGEIAEEVETLRGGNVPVAMLFDFSEYPGLDQSATANHDSGCTSRTSGVVLVGKNVTITEDRECGVLQSYLVNIIPVGLFGVSLLLGSSMNGRK